jgi:hypothetical protein
MSWWWWTRLGLEGHFGLFVVEVIIDEALQVGMDHLAPSIVLGLEPPRAQQGVDGVCRIPP